MIVTVDDVKESLKPDMVVDVDAAVIQQLIDAITDTAEEFTNSYLQYGEYTEIFDGNSDATVVLLRGIKIWSIESVKFDDIEQVSGYFKIHDRLGGVYSKIGFPDGTLNVEITYTAGYDAEEEEGEEESHKPPEGLKRAIIDEVVLRYEYHRSQSKTGEQIVDLKKDFLHGESEKYFKKLRRTVRW